MELPNHSNNAPTSKSTENTIIISNHDDDDGNSDGSQYESTQNVIVIVLSDDDKDNVNMATHQQHCNAPEHMKCIALQIEFPPGQTPHNSYPFTMHDANSLCWDIKIHQNVLYL